MATELVQGLTLEEYVVISMEKIDQSIPSFQERSRTKIAEPPGYLIEGEASTDDVPWLLKLVITLNGDYGVVALVAVREGLWELHEPMLDRMLASLQTFPPEKSSASDRKGLWIGTVSSPNLVDFITWVRLDVTPGVNPDKDLWRFEFFGLGFRCTPERIENGWELADCTELEEVPGISKLTAFVPEQGETGVVLRFEFDSSPVAIPLARLPQKDEPQASANVTMIWHEEGNGTHTDIWADDGLVFAPRFDGQIEIMDAVSGQILSVVSVPEGDEGRTDRVQDVKTRNGRLYAATLFNGIVVFDISQPTDPKLMGQYRVFVEDDSLENFTNIHNIFLSPQGNLVYAINNSSLGSDLRIIDFSDPTSSKEAGRFAIDTDVGFVHDLNVMEQDGRLIAFLNYWTAGLWILDVTDPGSITVLSSIEWDGIVSHSGWPFTLDDSLYYAHTEEGYDRHLTIIDVTDLENPHVVSRFSTREGLSIHNVQVVDGIAYISYYIDGLRVVDLRDPENPQEIGHFDTVPAEDERAIMGQGAWGVRVLDGIVFISDMQAGTYAFQVDVE